MGWVGWVTERAAHAVFPLGGVITRKHAGQAVLPLGGLRVEHPSERALLSDAPLVANLPAYRGRGEGSHLGHQLSRPLALAQQEDARVKALYVVRK